MSQLTFDANHQPLDYFILISSGKKFADTAETGGQNLLRFEHTGAYWHSWVREFYPQYNGLDDLHFYALKIPAG